MTGGWNQPPHRWLRKVAPGRGVGNENCCGRGKLNGASGVGPGEPLVKGPAMRIPVSVLDLAPIAPGATATDAIAASVALAQRAEESGFGRVWYAEHHNMPSIASSATSVLIAHVGAQTSRIRLGAGGIMLPNHSPLTIAEQFGTLDAMYPGRIDLGLGRAPGSDQNTMYALRRDERSADRFPQDVLELQAYLAGETRVPGVDAVPGKGSNVPLYILGSSMFGATLAAALGLPFAFASHFAPSMLEPAVAAYRQEFRPSAQLPQPHVIAGVNAIAADTVEEAQQQLERIRRIRAVGLFGRGRSFTDEEADLLLESPAGRHIEQMLTHSAVGTGAQVAEYLEAFAKQADADELIVAFQSPTTEQRLRSVTLTAEALAD
jgi:luciferase family oxidoreductase group 1